MIWVKTDAGRVEMQARALVKDRARRNLLLLIDGVKSEEMLLAHLAGISAYTYQKFEKGESKPGTPMNPRLFTLLALADVLQVGLEDLLPAAWPDPEP